MAILWNRFYKLNNTKVVFKISFFGKSFFYFLFIFFSFQLRAQDSANWMQHVDSLKQQIQNTRKAGNSRLLAKSLLESGADLLATDQNPFAVNCVLESSQLFLSINDSVNYGWCLYYLGYSYNLTGQYNLSLEHCLKSSTIAENKKQPDLLGYDLILHGRLFYLLGNEDTAFSFYQKAIKIAEEIKDTKLKAEALMLSAVVLRNNRDLDGAFKLLEEALLLKERTLDELGSGFVYNNIAILYSYKKNDSTALQWFTKAEHVFRKFNNLFALTECYNAMAKSFLQLNNEQDAEKYFRSSLEIALKLRAKKLIRYNYYDLAMLNYAHGKNREAFDLMYLYSLYKDSVLHDQSLLESAQIENQISEEKNKQEIKLLNNSNELKETELAKSRIVILAITGCLSLLVVMILVIFYNLVQKRKINALLGLKNSEITEKNRSIVDSIKYARGIQEAILPPTELFREYLGECFIIYKPKDIVSGDFYWLHKINDQVFFASADCTGHGVPGAFMSLLGVQTLNMAIIENHIENPAKILDFANERTKELLIHRGLYDTTRDGMDIALCSLDTKKLFLEYAGANNPLWVLRKGELLETKADKRAIGAASKPFTNHSRQLEPGDSIYIFTDGFADQFGGPEQNKIKLKGLRELLLSIQKYPFADHAEHIVEFLDYWKGSNEQTDDILVICIHIPS